MARPIDVLFVCHHGAAKSVIAAAHCQRLAAERGLELITTSAGLDPDETIPAHVRDGLADDGLHPNFSTPVRVSDAMASRACRVVLLGVSDAEAGLDGVDVVQWDVPAVSDGYDAARKAIVAKVTALVDEIEAS